MTLLGMRIGRLDRRITVQVNTTTQDSSGEDIASWATLVIVWAQVSPKAAAESLQGDQVHATAVTEFRIRYRSDVTVATRISYNDQTYDITGVMELGRREGLLITATVRSLPSKGSASVQRSLPGPTTISRDT